MNSFQCQRCGACCRQPGFVKITREEIVRIAAYLGLGEDEFIQTLTRLTPTRSSLALIDKPDGTCCFLEDDGCRLQVVKPAQCVGFPRTWNFPGWEKICRAVGGKWDG